MNDVDVDRFVVRWKLMPIPRGLLYLSPPGEPNRERCGVVSAPAFALRWVEPDYVVFRELDVPKLKVGVISPLEAWQR